MKPIHEFLEEHCNHSASCLHTLVVLKFLTQCTAHNGESKNFEEESVYLCLAYVCSSELVNVLDDEVCHVRQPSKTNGQQNKSHLYNLLFS